MRIHRREAPLPSIREIKPQVDRPRGEGGDPTRPFPPPQQRRFIDPCDLFFRPLLGEFLGTAFLDFFAAQLLILATESFAISALCTGLLRYVLMCVFGDCCAGEFNPALSIGKLFCLERSLLLSMTIIGGQFFGAFIGEMMFLAIRPSVSQAFPFVFLNESDIFVDRLPSSFQAYFLIELINTSLFVVTYLRTGPNVECMAAVTVITMTLAFHAGLETRATGNLAQIVAHSVAGTLWISPSNNSWRYIEAASVAALVSPFISAVLYWLLRSAKDMHNEEEEKSVI